MGAGISGAFVANQLCRAGYKVIIDRPAACRIRAAQQPALPYCNMKLMNRFTAYSIGWGKKSNQELSFMPASD